MKKSAGISILLLIFSIFLFASCAKTPNFSAQFSQEEFVYSLGDEIDFWQELSLNGIEKDDVEISLLGNVGEQTESGFNFDRSGRGVVVAKVGGDTIASAAVVVKTVFDAPQNLQINQDGTLVWDEAFAYFDGEFVKATSYTVAVGQEEKVVTTNSYKFEQEGTYQVRVKANGVASKYVDESGWTSQNMLYDLLDPVKNVDLSSSSADFSNGQMVLSWEAPDSDHSYIYEVNFDGITLPHERPSTQQILDFSHFDGGDVAKVTITALDNRNGANKSFPSQVTIDVAKLQDIAPQFDEQTGRVFWGGLVGDFVLGYVNANNESSGVLRDFTQESGNNFSTLSGLQHGIYDITLQAKGGKIGEKYYADSAIAALQKVAKLGVPQFSVAFDEQNLIVHVQGDGYTERYMLGINGESRTVTVDQDRNITLPLSELDEGEIELSLVGLPSLIDDGQVQPISVGAYSTSLIVASDSASKVVYKLSPIENVVHALDGGNSVLTFDKLENTLASDYSVTLNGQPVATTSSEQGEKISLSISNLAGYKPDGYDYNFVITAKRGDGLSNEVKFEKTISVLGKVAAVQEQENGWFAWNGLAQSQVEYSYTIWSSDSDEAQGEQVTSQTTAECKTAEVLQFGYYLIKICAKSTDQNLYLDADFGGHIQDNFLQVHFSVFEQIASPEIEFYFDEEAGAYKLQFSNVHYATRYEIYVDGELLRDGVVVPGNTELEYFVHTFTEKFEDANGDGKDFEISLVAKVGEGGDSVLHPDSDAATLTVTRLPRPTFVLNKKEQLEIDLPQGAEDIAVLKDGAQFDQAKITAQEQKRIVSLNEIEGGTIVLQYKAVQGRSEHVYLDSEAKFVFKRLDTPSTLTFASGELGFNGADIENVIYNILLTLTTPNGDKSYYATSQSTKFSLNDFIDGKQGDAEIEDEQYDPEFVSDYSAATAISVSVQAYLLGEQEGIYYLPSRFSQAKPLEKLPEVTIAITDESGVVSLSWNGVGQEGVTTYTVHVGDGVFAEDVQGNVCVLDIDFLTQKTIWVHANNPAYLTSARSNTIYVRRLAPIAALQVDGQSFSAYIPSADRDQIESVLINGQKFEIAQNGTITEPFESFADVEYVLNFAVVAKANKDNEYVYLSSSQTKFVFFNLANERALSTHGDDEISFTPLCEKFAGVETSPLKYWLEILNSQGQTVNNIELKANNISLDDQTLTKLAAGKYTLKFSGTLDQYTISATDDGAIGYFGKKDIGSEQVEKYKSLTTYSYKVDEAAGDKIAKRRDGGVVITWHNEWEEQEVMFDLVFSGLDNPYADAFKNMTRGYTYAPSLDTLLSLEKIENDYVLTISDAAQFFKTGQTTIDVTVHKSGNIASDISQMTICRLEDVKNAQIASDGVLTFDGVTGANKYLLQLEIAGQKIDVGDIQSTESELSTNIWSYFGNYAGQYTVKIYADNDDNEYLPAKEEFQLKGYRLKGEASVTIQKDSGGVLIALSSDDKQYAGQVQFDLRFKDKLYALDAEPADLDNGEFFTSTVHILELLGEDVLNKDIEFDIFVHIEGSVNSQRPSNTCHFVYIDSEERNLHIWREKDLVDGQIVANKARDFLILTDQIEETTGLWLEFRYTTLDENKMPHDNVVTLFPLDDFSMDDFKGFWIKGKDGQEYFATDLPSQYSNQTPCFAICLNDILEGYDGGEYTFVASRICSEGGVVTQYGSTKLKFVKLDAIDGGSIALSNGMLTWRKTDQGADAYYVNFYAKDGEDFKFVSHIEVNQTTSFDMTKYISEPNNSLYFSISAISGEEGVLASNESHRYNVWRYDRPNTVEVVGGKLQFSLESIKQSEFLKDIRDNFKGGSDYLHMAEILTSKTYYAPFTFTANNILQATVQLKFTSADSIGSTYFFTMRAIDLLAEGLKDLTFSYSTYSPNYIQTLYDCAVDQQVFTSTSYALPMRNLVMALNDSRDSAQLRVSKDVSKFGLGSAQILFDDYGNAIPNGTYKISVRQNGQDLNKTTENAILPSEYGTEIVKSVSQEPIIRFDVQEEEDKNIYYLSFLPVKIDYLEGEAAKTIDATKYVLSLRKEGESPREFEIRREDEGWHLFYDGGSFELSQRVYGGQNYVTIDLTNQFAKRIDNLPTDASDVAIYAVGNDYALNSKTDEKSLSFLKFDYKSMTLVNGRLSWNSKNKNGTLVRFKHENSSGQFVVSGQSTQALMLPVNGQYEYVSFTALGGMSENSCAVDSESFGITNLYKRFEPSATVEKGVFTFAGSDQESGSPLELATRFNVSNDQADGNWLTTEGSEYRPGNYQGYSKDSAEYAVRFGETSASEFYLTAAGNSIIIPPETEGDQSHFVISSESREWFDHLLDINSKNITNCVLESDMTTVSARMLSPSTSAKIHDGDLVFESPYFEQADQIEQGLTIVYRINVYYYQGLGVATSLETRTFWTTSNTFPTDRIEEVANGKYFSISVTPFAMRLVESSYIGEKVATIDKKQDGTIIYASHASNPQYADEGGLILLGTESVYGSGKIEKIDRPLSLEIDGANLAIKQQVKNRQEKFSFKIFDNNGRQIKGVFSESNYSSENNGASIYQNVIFTPEAQQFVYGTAYTLSAYAYLSGDQTFEQGAKITSFGRTNSKQIYKLAALSKSDIDIDFETENGVLSRYILNFDAYFKNHQILNSGRYMKIVARLGDDLTVEVLSTTPTLALVVSDETENPTLQIQDGRSVVLVPSEIEISFDVQAISNENDFLILASDECDSLMLRQASFGEEDKVTWENETHTVTWTGETSTMVDGEPVAREFVAMIAYQDGSNEMSDIITAQSPQELFYKPNKMGTITNIKVFVRDGKFSFFSNPITLEGILDFNLFAGGLGTQEQPYKIANAQQFANICERNSAGKKYYFELTGDITLDIDFNGQAPLFPLSFYGELNGNNHVLTINYTGAGNLASQLTESLPTGATSVENLYIASAASLFASIADSAAIMNIELKVSADITSAAGVVLAPLAATNAGKISGVKITQITLKKLTATSGRNLFALAGLVCDNNGTISNCENSAIIDMRVGSTGSAMPYVMYAGIALKNSGTNARIANCFSSGSVSIEVARNNSTVWATGIVGSALAHSVVTNCGNDATFNVQASSSALQMTAICAAIALRTNGSEILMCYNNGHFNLKDNQTYGGIVYTISQSTISYVVDTSGAAIARHAIATNSDQCYARETVSGITKRDLEQTTISVNSDQYAIKITLEGDQYVARLTKLS